MESTQAVLDTITGNSRYMQPNHVNRLIILYEETDFFIGDNCLRFDQLRACKQFFNNAVVDINFSNRKFADRYKALLKNNPNIDSVSYLDWEEIDLRLYDAVICITYEEQAFLEFLSDRYQHDILSKQWNVAVYSATLHFMKPMGSSDMVFPVCGPLLEYTVSITGLEPVELYLSADEREWGNQWLRDQGLKEDEHLFIMLDSTSRRKKLLKVDVYFNVLSFLLEQEKVKVLIFDEKNIGKEAFYRQWLGDKKANRLIFSRSMKLREDLCILSSDYIKLIFGPCTGLMHCASSIFNHFVKKGMAVDKVPLMVTYTGKYWKLDQIWDACITAYYWWGNSPLVNCLIIRKGPEEKEMVELCKLDENERNVTSNLLFCESYTQEMLTGYLASRLNDRVSELFPLPRVSV